MEKNCGLITAVCLFVCFYFALKSCQSSNLINKLVDWLLQDCEL